MIQKYCFRGAEYTAELIENIMHDWCLDLMIKSIIMKSDIYYTTCWRVIMKVWSVCFPDSFSRSHAHMFFIYLSFFLQGLWIIVWIWAFFFLLLGLGLLNQIFCFGLTKKRCEVGFGWIFIEGWPNIANLRSLMHMYNVLFCMIWNRIFMFFLWQRTI